MRDRPVIVRDLPVEATEMRRVMRAALLRTRVIEFANAAARVQLQRPGSTYRRRLDRTGDLLCQSLVLTQNDC
jgi:hypothetical protein